MKGKNISNLTDKNGKKIIQEQIKIVQAGKSGWVDYWWANPKTGKLDHKNTYVEKCVIQCTGMDGTKQETMIACGVYWEEK